MLHHARRRALGALARRGAVPRARRRDRRRRAGGTRVRGRTASSRLGTPGDPLSADRARGAGSSTPSPPWKASSRRSARQRRARPPAKRCSRMRTPSPPAGTPAARVASGGRRAHPTWPPDPKKTTLVPENPPRSRSAPRRGFRRANRRGRRRRARRGSANSAREAQGEAHGRESPRVGRRERDGIPLTRAGPAGNRNHRAGAARSKTRKTPRGRGAKSTCRTC